MSSTPSCFRYHFTFTVFPSSWLHLKCPSKAGFAARISSVMSKIMEAIHSTASPEVIGRVDHLRHSVVKVQQRDRP
jgi:hypothetical protein